MNIIKEFFSQEARDRRECRNDNKRLATLSRLADKAINVTYINDGIWITIDSLPTFRVTNDSDLNSRTIAIGQVELFIKELRENYIAAHKDDRLEERARV